MMRMKRRCSPTTGSGVSTPSGEQEPDELSNSNKRNGGRLSLMTAFTSVLIFLGSIKVGIFAGYGLINTSYSSTSGVVPFVPVDEQHVALRGEGNNAVNIRKSKSVVDDSSSVAGEGELTNDNLNQHQSTGCNFDYYIQRFRPEELEITCDNIQELEIGKAKGNGSKRQVHEATWQGKTVAIKRFYGCKNGDCNHKIFYNNIPNKKLTREAAMLFQLRDSENIMKLIGFCNGTMVSEFAPITLQTLIMDKEMEISLGRTLLLAIDVLRGLAQLHGIPNGPITHGDLQLGQLLINSKGRVLLNDFDRSQYTGLDERGKKCYYSKDYVRDSWWLSLSHSAPEVMSMKHELDEKTDIYEMALILWALRARKWPYEWYIGESEQKEIIAGRRPNMTLVSDYPEEMKDMIRAAWDSDPMKRPSAASMVKTMEGIVEKYSKGLRQQS